MADHQLEVGIGPHGTVRPQEAGGEVQPDDPAAFGDRIELPVGEVASGRAQRMDVGMRWRRAAPRTATRRPRIHARSGGTGR